jgi:hypothetical protein
MALIGAARKFEISITLTPAKGFWRGAAVVLSLGKAGSLRR